MSYVLKMEDFLWINYKKHKELKKIKSNRYQEIIKSYVLSKEQKEEIDDFYLTYYGEKIPYDWHRYYSHFSGVFDKSYFPDFLLVPFFEHYQNFNKAYAEVYENKNIIPYIAKAADIQMPRTIISRTCGVIRCDGNIQSLETAEKYLENIGKVFCKPSIVACGGRGCSIANFHGGIDITTGKRIRDVILSLGEDFVIQEIIKCHPSISDIYSTSVNTFRIITYRWKNDFLHMPVFMRIGQGGSIVDNGAAGGIFIGVRDNGILTGKACTTYISNIMHHPDTGIVFKDYKIESFNMVIEAALKMHKMIPEIGMVYWDFTINQDGIPVLIECNIRNGTIYAIQMTHGVSCFGNKISEVLQWIRKMNNTPYEKRINYAWGN